MPKSGGGRKKSAFTVGRVGEKQDAVELVAPRVPVVEFTVHIDEDVYEAAMLRATYDGYDNASEVVEAALREWARGTRLAEMHPASCGGAQGSRPL